MSRTLLQLIQDACDELNLPRPTAVIGNTDDTIRTLLFMSQRMGRQLMRAHDWTILQRTHTLATVSGTEEYSLPADYNRLLGETQWNRTTKQPMLGPTNPIEWQIIKSGGLGSGIVSQRMRIYRASSGVTRKIWIDPAPTSADTLAFEYISDYWQASTGGTAQATWTVDTDVSLLDDDLLTLATVVRFRRSKGFGYASQAQELNELFDILVTNDRPAPPLNLAGSRGNVARLLDESNFSGVGLGS